jgi:hypothetical protein
LTCRTLHFWHVAICSMSVTEPVAARLRRAKRQLLPLWEYRFVALYFKSIFSS